METSIFRSNYFCREGAKKHCILFANMLYYKKMKRRSYEGSFDTELYVRDV